MAKAKKTRAKTYDKPVKIQGTFSDVIKVAMTPKQTDNFTAIRDGITFTFQKVFKESSTDLIAYKIFAKKSDIPDQLRMIPDNESWALAKTSTYEAYKKYEKFLALQILKHSEQAP